MNGDNSFDIEMMQKYPMRMTIGKPEIDEFNCRFETQFSRDDFFREKEDFIPVSFFIELLGQAAELYFLLTDEYCKRYLAQVDNFKVNPELFQKLENCFVLEVVITQKFGKLCKSHVSLSQAETIYCEGDYVHCNT